MTSLGYFGGVPLRLHARPSRGYRLRKPTDIAQYRLVGPRRFARLRIVLAVDVSPSMEPFREARDEAITLFTGWAVSAMRRYDSVGIMEFAEDAWWTHTPAPLEAAIEAADEVDEARRRAATGTALTPVLDLAGGLPAGPSVTSVWMLSDGLFLDYPRTSDHAVEMLRAAGVDSLPLLIPDSRYGVPEEWGRIFPSHSARVFPGRDPEATAITFATTLAEVTGQHLVVMRR